MVDWISNIARPPQNNGANTSTKKHSSWLSSLLLLQQKEKHNNTYNWLLVWFCLLRNGRDENISSKTIHHAPPQDGANASKINPLCHTWHCKNNKQQSTTCKQGPYGCCSLQSRASLLEKLVNEVKWRVSWCNEVGSRRNPISIIHFYSELDRIISDV